MCWMNLILSHAPSFERTGDIASWTRDSERIGDLTILILGWIPQEAGTQVKMGVQVLYLGGDPRKHWLENGKWGREGKSAHTGCVFIPFTTVGSCGSLPLGNRERQCRAHTSGLSPSKGRGSCIFNHQLSVSFSGLTVAGQAWMSWLPDLSRDHHVWIPREGVVDVDRLWGRGVWLLREHEGTE